MNVAIVGYGGMGREVEKVLKDRGHQVSARIDPKDPGADARELTPEIARDSDVAIEFTHAAVVLDNARAYCRHGLSAVVGTTGWFDRLDELKKIMEGGKIGYLYGSNFSVGAHLFFALAASATELANTSPEYDLMAWEIHHGRKKDSPSGTALTLGRIVTGRSVRKTRVVTERLDRPPAPDELHIASVRGGQEPGTHTLRLDSQFDTIEITHRARSRGGFALGAVRAAEWMTGRKGLFEVNDFVREMLEGERGA